MTLDTVNGHDKLHAVIQQEYKILAEYKMLQSEIGGIGGVYVIPSFESSFIWFGVIFVRDGIYKDGIFRFTISLPEQFPNTTKPPSVIFQSDVFHPIICPYTGTLDLTKAFPVWQCGENHIWQLLKYVIYSFQYPTSTCDESSVVSSNQEAYDLLTQNKSEYYAKLKECIRVSRDKIFDPLPTDDKHNIVFERFDGDVHGPVLESIKSRSELSMSPPTSGLSWIKPADFQSHNKQ